MEKFGKALIIEDDRDVQRAARVALGTHFSSITLAENAAHLDQWLDASTDVVLLDMNFALGVSSGRDGLHALARIRVIDPALSVVLMTAYGSVSLAVETLKQGAVDFVLKPWRNEELVAIVRAAAERTRAAPKSTDAISHASCSQRGILSLRAGVRALPVFRLPSATSTSFVRRSILTS